MKCSACGKVAVHDVGRIVVDPDYWSEVASAKSQERWPRLLKLHWEKWTSFTGYFVCPECGAGGPWQFPAAAKRTMALHILRYIVDREKAGVIVGRLIIFDGTSPRTAFEGVQHFEALIAADPSNAYLWNRFGNHLVTAGLDERAMRIFEKAVEL